MKDKKDKSGKIIFVLLILVAITVFFFPTIYQYIEKFSMPKIEKTKQEETDKNGNVEQEVLDTLHYPLMRSSKYSASTYYTLDTFSIADMSNNDILMNAFLDIYEGNMTTYSGGVSCTNSSKEFNKDYIELRIKNILGKSVNYTLENFNVSEDLDTPYVGSWNYDGTNGRFIYNGLCSNNSSNVTYYNLEELIKAEYDDRDVIVYDYVGFAKVDGDKYTIYSDAAMTKELKTGEYIDIDSLNNVFKSIDKKDKKVYKYTFKNTLCSYNEYCLYKGEWTNEL